MATRNTDGQSTWNAVVIDPGDNVAVALSEITTKAVVANRGAIENLSLCEAISPGHKFAIRAIKAGEPVLKYGQAIGVATMDIAAGATVHVHNLKSNRCVV